MLTSLALIVMQDVTANAFCDFIISGRPYLCFAYSLGRIFHNRSEPHQLARIQFHLLPPAPDQPALGSDACSALRLVAISQRGDDRPEDRCVVRLTYRSALRLDGGELHNRDRLRGDQNLESARHTRALGVLWERPTPDVVNRTTTRLPVLAALP